MTQLVERQLCVVCGARLDAPIEQDTDLCRDCLDPHPDAGGGSV